MEIEIGIKISSSHKEQITAAVAAGFCDGENGAVEDRKLLEQGMEDKSETRQESNEGSKKKRCRRKRKAGEHHRAHGKWSWDDKKDFETTEKSVKRDRRFASLQAMGPRAPNNTNEFLMADQDLPSTPVYHNHGPAAGEVRPTVVHHHHGAAATENSHLRPGLDGEVAASPAYVGHPRRKSGEDQSFSGVEGDSDSSVGYNQGSVESEDELYLRNDFMNVYENYRSERLMGMNKEELIKECIRLDTRLDKLENQNTRLVKENEHLKQQTLSTRRQSNPVER